MLFSKWFKKESKGTIQEGESVIQEMKDSLLIFMTGYAIQKHDNMESLAGIFASAQNIINSVSPKEVQKEMSKNSVSAESIVLNIIQNCAMYEIKASTKDFLFGQEDEAFVLYMDINDEKLEKGYISKEQYEENKRLGTCLKIGIRLV